MGKINSRNKGASGEREFCRWLSDMFNLDELPQRNLEQVRSGGADVIFPPFMFEVKRCQTLALHKWWIQVKTASNKPFPVDGKMAVLEPVVAFRQNNKDWEFLISANHIGVRNGYIHLTESTFKRWVFEFLERKAKYDAAQISHGLKVIEGR